MKKKVAHLKGCKIGTRGCYSYDPNDLASENHLQAAITSFKPIEKKGRKQEQEKLA